VDTLDPAVDISLGIDGAALERAYEVWVAEA
jgi:hypothetical protein